MPLASEILNRATLPVKIGSRVLNRLGIKYERLTVIEFFDIDPVYGMARWLCQCECGNTSVIYGTSVGKTKSCGCLAIENMKKVSFRHGETVGNGPRSTEYKTWDSIKQRCANPNSTHYVHYGGRGIKVCARWIDSFQNFLSDMGRKPSPNHTIERNDTNGNYEPSNCRWATNDDQQNNRRNNRTAEFQGKTQTFARWERELGFGRGTITWRLGLGWSIEKSLSTPIMKHMARPQKRKVK